MEHTNSRRGFTLIEMLVVIGILAILIAASIGGYSKFVKSAQKARCTELVHNVATAMVAAYQQDNAWPRTILSASGAAKDAELDEKVGAALARRKVLSLSYRSTAGDKDTQNNSSGSSSYVLTGNDRFGVVTTWAQDVIKRNPSASTGTKVPSGGTVADHRLHFAIDDDDDGFVNASVGGKQVKVRASAIVWCCGADGKIETYGKNCDDIYSWSLVSTEEGSKGLK